MALRSKMLTKELDAEEPAQELFSQRRKPDVGQFRLQVDRQTKASFPTFEAAEQAGLVIKKAHPVVRGKRVCVQCKHNIELSRYPTPRHAICMACARENRLKKQS